MPGAISQADAAQRWRWLGCLPVLAGRAALSEPPDAVALVPGIDGSSNWGSQAMLKYLFLGSRSSGALEPTVRAEDEALEDVVLVVRAQREKESFGADVAVYAPAAAGSSATRLITTLAGPNRHILRSDEADRDADKAEEFKARAFVDMVRGCKRVAFPLDSPPAGAEASPGHVASSPVERWPLVQAYGNADLATGGFFTMVHSVSDATAAVGALLSHVDAHALRSVACSAASTLQQQMSLTVALAAARRTPARRATMSVQLLADALRNFAEFSAMQAPDGDAHVPPAARVGDAEPGPAGEASAAPAALCGAGVVVGEATGAEDPAAALAAPPATPLAEAGAGGSPALHGVAEAWDPASGLRASRVLFLSAPRAPSGPEAVLRNVHAALLASHRAALAALSSLVDASSAGAFPPPGELAAALLRSSARVWRRPAAARSLPRGTRAADLLSVRIETVDGCGRVSGVAVASKAGVASSSASAASGSPTPPPFGRTLVRVRSFIGPLPSGLGGLAVGDTLVAVPRASLLPPMFRPADSSGEVGGAAADDEAPETPTPTGDGAPSGGSSGEAPGGEAAGAGGAHAAPPGSGGSVVVNLTAAFPHGAVLDCLAGGAGQLASEAAEAMAGEGDDALSDSPAQSQASMTGLLGKEIAGSRVRNVAMLLGGTVTPSDQVSLVAYEDGLLLRSPGRGSLALSFSKHVAGVRVVSGKAAASAVGLALADPDARRAAVQAWAGAGLDELAASADAFDRAADSKGAAGMLGLGGSAAGRASTSLSASRLEALTCPPDVLVISLFGADTAAASNGGGGGASGGTPAAGTGGAAAAGAAAAASGAGGSSHVEATAAAGEQSPAQAAQATPARSSTSVPWAEAAPLWSTSRLEQTPSLALGLVLPAGSTERSSVLANLRRWSRSVETAALERRLAADDDSAAAPVQPKPSAEAVESAFRLAGAGEDNLPAGLRPAYADTALAPLRTAWTALDACEKARLGDAATVDRILCSGSRSGAAEAEATAVPAAAVAAGAPGWLEPGVAPWGLSAEPRTDAGKAEPSSRAAAAVPVLVLCGAAGSGRSQLARAVAEASGETHSWAVARSLPSWSAAGDARASAGATTAAASVSTGTGACSVGDWSESMQPAKVRAALEAAARSAVATAGSTDRAPAVIFLPPPGACAAVSCAAVAGAGAFAALAHAPAAPMLVGGCAVCVHSQSAFTDARATRPMPGSAFDAQSRGFATHILVTGQDDAPAAANALRAAIGASSPAASVVPVRGGVGRALAVPRDTLRELAAGEAFASRKSVAARAASCPQWWRGVGHPTVGALLPRSPATGGAAVLRLPCLVALARDSVERMLRDHVRQQPDEAAACLADRPSPAQGAAAVQVPAPAGSRAFAWRAQGLLRCAPALVGASRPLQAGSAEGAAQVSATGPAAASAARFRTVDAVPGAAPRILAPNEAMGRVGNGAPSCGWLDLHGHGPALIAAAAGLAAQLDGCRPVTPSPAPARSAASLTPAERRQIKDANLYAPLPEEFQFDGTGYSTLSGSSQAFHPSMAEFEERFVAEANARREAYNASLAALRERRRAEEQAAAAVWASRGEAGTKALAAVPSHASAALADPWWADLPPELPLDVNCARPYFDGADGRRSVEVPAISADEGRVASPQRGPSRPFSARRRPPAAGQATAGAAPAAAPRAVGAGAQGTAEGPRAAHGGGASSNVVQLAAGTAWGTVGEEECKEADD